MPCRNVKVGLGGRGPQKLPKEETSGQDLQSACAFGEHGITSSADEEKEIKMAVNSGRSSCPVPAGGYLVYCGMSLRGSGWQGLEGGKEANR